jgi:hypothetical protein
MKTKHVYTAASLEHVLGLFEERFGLSTLEFYEAYESGNVERFEHIPRFHRHVWASFYRDVRRMRGDDFAESAERTLTLA